MADDTPIRFTLNFGPEQHWFWVLEKLTLAVEHLKPSDLPLEQRVEAACYEIAAVAIGDVPVTLCDKISFIREQLNKPSITLSTEELEHMAETIQALHDHIRELLKDE